MISVGYTGACLNPNLGLLVPRLELAPLEPSALAPRECDLANT
jgi:hypothetical protein